LLLTFKWSILAELFDYFGVIPYGTASFEKKKSTRISLDWFALQGG
jgi:hypothetical protein